MLQARQSLVLFAQAITSKGTSVDLDNYDHTGAVTRSTLLVNIADCFWTGLQHVAVYILFRMATG